MGVPVFGVGDVRSGKEGRPESAPPPLACDGATSVTGTWPLRDG